MSKADPRAPVDPPPQADRPRPRKPDREARLAQALRDNLRRRKAGGAGEAADRAPPKD